MRWSAGAASTGLCLARRRLFAKQATRPQLTRGSKARKGVHERRVSMARAQRSLQRPLHPGRPDPQAAQGHDRQARGPDVGPCAELLERHLPRCHDGRVAGLPRRFGGGFRDGQRLLRRPVPPATRLRRQQRRRSREPVLLQRRDPHHGGLRRTVSADPLRPHRGQHGNLHRIVLHGLDARADLRPRVAATGAPHVRETSDDRAL